MIKEAFDKTVKKIQKLVIINIQLHSRKIHTCQCQDTSKNQMNHLRSLQNNLRRLQNNLRRLQNNLRNLLKQNQMKKQKKNQKAR